jgi:hypothetical protein
MLIIPTAELIGLLTDVMPLMPADKKAADRIVRVEWDGAQLLATAADGVRAGTSAWDPDDPSEHDGKKYEVVYGPTNRPEPKWSVYLHADDVAEIVKAFKLADKFGGVPLMVRVNDTGTRFIVERSRETGKTAHLMTVTPLTDARLPNVRVQVGELWSERSSTGRVVCWAHRLGGFLAAGRRGPLAQIPTGPAGDGPVIVKVGNRFVGHYLPEREPRATPRSEVGMVVHDMAEVSSRGLPYHLPSTSDGDGA